MKKGQVWYGELTRLVTALLDERITEEQQVRLNALLEEEPEARKAYLQYMHMDDALPEVLVPLPGDAGARGVAETRAKWGVRELVAALLLVTVTAGIVHTVSRISQADVQRGSELAEQQGEDVDIPPATSDTLDYKHEEVAVLSRAVDVVWDKASERRNIGSGLGPGRLALRSGLIQIEFFSGVSLVVEGPAELEIVSSMEAFCHKGRMRAFVPHPAKGFTVHTPGVDVIDWGTEFALQVNEAQECELHVITGEVELESRTTFTVPEELNRLTTGQAVRYTDTGEVSEIVADLMSFIGHVRLMEMAESTYGVRYENWLLQTERLQADPARILYYTFQDHKPWDRIVRNAGAVHAMPSDGAIVGCKWTEGRWPRKGALEFKRTTDRVRIFVPGEFESISCLAWVRIEGMETWLNSLMLTDGWDEGELHWQLSNHGEIDMGIQGSINALSPPVIAPAHLGHWVHIASVYNPAAQELVHYFNGVPVSRHDLVNVVGVRIGAAEIGNWNPNNIKSQTLRSLNGRIDEFGLFSRAFSDAEVQAIYVAGR